jgi:hypothetical protein
MWLFLLEHVCISFGDKRKGMIRIKPFQILTIKLKFGIGTNRTTVHHICFFFRCERDTKNIKLINQ